MLAYFSIKKELDLILIICQCMQYEILYMKCKRASDAFDSQSCALQCFSLLSYDRPNLRIFHVGSQ